MDVTETFSQFSKEVFDETIEFDDEKVVEEFEQFYSDIVLIIQKNDEFFSKERIVFGRNISLLDESRRERIWKNLLACMLCSFFHGDIKKKVEKVSEIVKNLWNASGQKNDDITNILNDEQSQGRFEEIIDFVLNSRLAKIFTNLVESFDVSEFELNITDPSELIELLKNPENPMMKKIQEKIQSTIKQKIQRGDISQQMIVTEIEAIKAKVIGLFGNIFNDALGGRKSDVSGSVLTANSPEARRQRMIARMQRKVREKNSKQ
jgi:hypothetical protein